MTTAATKPAIEADAIVPVEAPVASTTVFSTTALVLSVVGIVLGQGLISIAAIIFGFVGRTKEAEGRLIANWGIVLGFVGVFGGAMLALLGIAAFLPIWLGAALTGWF